MGFSLEQAFDRLYNDRDSSNSTLANI